MARRMTPKHIKEKIESIKNMFKDYPANVDVFQSDIRCGKGYMLVKKDSETGAIEEITWFFDTLDDLERFCIYFLNYRDRIDKQLNSK